MKEIKEFPGYFVTGDGKVFSAWKKQSITNEKGIIVNVKHYIEYSNLKELKLSSDGNGYLKVMLSLDKKQYTKTVHRLVAKSYIPNPNNLPVINHKNEIKYDNRVENLEWMTRQQNITHAFVVLGRESVTRPIYYDGIKYNSIKECAMVNGFSHHSLCATLSSGKQLFKKKPISYAGKGLRKNKPTTLLN